MAQNAPPAAQKRVNPQLVPTLRPALKTAKSGLLGISPNEPYQAPNGVFRSGNFDLAIVELDDQGRCHNRIQVDAFDAELTRLQGKDPIIVLFVHGWKHNADGKDDNLINFCNLIDSARQTLRDARKIDRPMLAVFLAWRGKSLYGAYTENLTFLDRKGAGLRVAMGAAREVFERLRDFRRNEKSAGHNPTVILIGHSFGGLVAFSAIAQSLVGAALTPSNSVAPSYADLILLLNPAFEAVRYLPIHDLLKVRDAPGLPPAPPFFISVTASNDFDTKWWFPRGMIWSYLRERTKGPEERAALVNTMGHLDFLRTHALALENGEVVANCVQFSPNNPFWTASAPPALINGHNGIWGAAFTNWIEEILVTRA